jgi:uncharacterized damage-inducible protein DinB
MGAEVNHLIDLMLTSLNQTLAQLAVLANGDLDSHSDHPCAMGGTVRDLLTHNVDHERMHVGQVYSARYGLKRMQKGQVARLMAETLRARADLIASLIGLSDDALDAAIPDEDWTIRQMIDHTIYWERNSMDELAAQHGDALPADLLRSSVVVADPIYGPLDGPLDQASSVHED